MKVYSEQVIREVEDIIRNHLGNLVLIKWKSGDSEEFPYVVTDKVSHSCFLIDDEDVVELLINKLLDQKVDIFDDLNHLEKVSPRNPPKPLFWPEDKPWPPRP